MELSAMQAFGQALAFVAGASFVSYGVYALLAVRWQQAQEVPAWVWITVAVPWLLGCIICGFRSALQRKLVWVILGGAVGTVTVEIVLIVTHAVGFRKSLLHEDLTAYLATRVVGSLLLCGVLSLTGALARTAAGLRSRVPRGLGDRHK